MNHEWDCPSHNLIFPLSLSRFQMPINQWFQLQMSSSFYPSVANNYGCQKGFSEILLSLQAISIIAHVGHFAFGKNKNNLYNKSMSQICASECPNLCPTDFINSRKWILGTPREYSVKIAL